MMPSQSYSSVRRSSALFWTPPRAILAAVGLALLSLAAPAARAQDSAVVVVEKNASAGAYTDEQAKRGEGVYNANCLACHSAKAYTGDAFRIAWLTRSVFELFNRIRTTMPDDNPGMLERQAYADIVAYMLSLNGYPPGPAELPSEDEPLKHVKIDSLPPKPPNAHGLWSAVLLRRQLRGHGAR